MTTTWPLLLSICAALCACASDPTSVAENKAPACVNGDPPTGTMVIRRDRCVETSEEKRDQARRQIEAMQEDQRRRGPKVMGN